MSQDLSQSNTNKSDALITSSISENDILSPSNTVQQLTKSHSKPNLSSTCEEATQEHSQSKYQSLTHTLNKASSDKHHKLSGVSPQGDLTQHHNLYSIQPHHSAPNLLSNPPHHSEHADASYYAFPINPFDHLMPHKQNIGTPNMAWIGQDGLVHTPKGGVYAKTTEAVANFRRELQYDSAYYRTRQRYICLILLIIFLTVSAVVVLLTARSVDIVDVVLMNGDRIWTMHQHCATNQTVSNGCNVTISPLLDVKINNHNLVPATVETWSVRHVFFCTEKLVCPSGGTVFGDHSVIIQDGDDDINRKNSGYAVLNDTEMFVLPGCTLFPPNGTYCEWQSSCFGDSHPGHFVIEIHITAELSYALKSTEDITSVVRLGTYCNGTAVVCKVDEKVKNWSKTCE